MKIFNIVLGILVFVLLSLNILNIITVGTITTTAKPREYSEITVKAVDSKSGNPIENAQVIIIETQTKHTTDKKGNSEAITVPVIRNAAYDNTKKSDWGEITILVRASGYADHIMFSVRVKHKQRRIGIVVPLNLIINAEDNQTTVTVEQPDAVWIEELIKSF